MDPQKFDDIIRRSSQTKSRRGMLRSMAAGLAAANWVAHDRSALAADVAAEIFGFCKLPNAGCDSDAVCCSHHCSNGACTCKKKGARCFSAIGLSCCSRRCKKGKCK